MTKKMAEKQEEKTTMFLSEQPASMATRDSVCYVEVALSILGGKWTLLLIHELMEGPKRFSELRRMIPEASAKMLTMRLRDLEISGIVNRRVFAEVPPHVEYRLTEKGQALRMAIEDLRIWGLNHGMQGDMIQIDSETD
jgi:DNA-binding HxlR family transcriptional regulator